MLAKYNSLFEGVHVTEPIPFPSEHGWFRPKDEPNVRIEGSVNISDNAKVTENAWVYGNAKVYGKAKISGNARVSGNAWVFGYAKVYGNAWVYGDVLVYGNARVYENALVFGKAWVHGRAQVAENAQVSGNAQVAENAHVYGNAQVYGNALVYGNAYTGNMPLTNKKTNTTPNDNNHKLIIAIDDTREHKQADVLARNSQSAIPILGILYDKTDTLILDNDLGTSSEHDGIYILRWLFQIGIIIPTIIVVTMNPVAKIEIEKTLAENLYKNVPGTNVWKQT